MGGRRNKGPSIRFSPFDNLTLSLFDPGEIALTGRWPHTEPMRPTEPLPGWWMHLDMDAFFASCEQMMRPELAGKAVAIVPVMADNTYAIATSYEAKRRNIKTGTSLEDAKLLFPLLRVITARPRLYRQIHYRIIACIENLLPVHQVLSVDEMLLRPPEDLLLPQVQDLARQIQAAIKEEIGLTASIGIAQNGFLAKTVADMDKPCGLTTLTPEDMPEKTYGLKLTDWPGIGSRMVQRFYRYGVFSTQEMYQLSIGDLRAIFKSVQGERWWRFIRGLPVELPPVKKTQVGHSSVLPPGFRSVGGAWSTACRLLEKAAERLREGEYHARVLRVSVSRYPDDRHPMQDWSRSVRFAPCDETLPLLRLLDQMWTSHLRNPIKEPSHVTVTLGNIIRNVDVMGNLFRKDERTKHIDAVVDSLNRKFGRGTVLTAPALPARDFLNHDRIPFGPPTPLR